MYWTIAAAIGICTLLPGAAAQDAAAELPVLDRQAGELHAKLKRRPRDEGLRRNLAELAMRSASALERANSAGDEALAGSYRKLLLKHFGSTGWRLEQMSKQGKGEAAHALGVFELHGVFKSRDIPSACSHFIRALSTGFSGARFRVAQCLAEQDAKRSAGLMKEAADAGNAWALEIVGRNCLETSPPDAECARDRLLAASAAGRPSAQVLLAWALAQGISGQPDFQRAARLYRQAAEKGFASAQNNLGELYESGRGVEADPKQALLWYRRAAEAGFAPGQFNFGRVLAAGLGGPVDFPKAKEWLQKAEAGGVTQAHTLLEWMERQSK